MFTRVPDGFRPIRPGGYDAGSASRPPAWATTTRLHGLRRFTATQLGAVAEAATLRERMGDGSLTVSSIYTTA